MAPVMMSLLTPVVPLACQVELFLNPMRSERDGGVDASLRQAAVAYFDPFKVVDVLTLTVMSICFVLRALLWLDSTDTRGAGAHVDYLMGPGVLGFEWDTVQTLMQIVQSCLAFAVVAVFFRFLSLGWLSDDASELVVRVA